MKKVLKGLLFVGLGVILEIIVIFLRYTGVDYLKLSALPILYFLSGILISRSETKAIPYSLLFLLPTVFVLVYSAIDNPPVMIRLIAELITLVPSFLLGLFFFRMRPNLRMPAIVLLITAYAIFIFNINPQLIYRKHSSNKTNSKILENKIEYVFINKDSSVINSSMLINKVVLLDYWFIRCGPCIKKMSELKKIADHFKGRKDFIVLAVDDGLRDKFSDYLQFTKKLPQELTYVYDSKGKSTSELNIEYFPHEILLDKKGTVRHQVVGYTTDLSLVYSKNTIEKIENLLNEK